MECKLFGSSAIVTGGGKGIGRVIALALAREGCRVMIGDIDLESAQGVVEEIQKLGSRAAALEIDVAVKADAERLAEKTLEQFGGLHILVNNAGMYPSAPVLEIKEEQWDRVVDVNLKGVFNCSQAAARVMVGQGGGRIVNIASIDGRTGTQGIAHYASAKAGVIGLTKALATELAPYGINVNAVAPGWVATETLLKGDRWKEIVKKIPLGTLARVEDIASGVLFLASDRAPYITGETLNINGGLLME